MEHNVVAATTRLLKRTTVAYVGRMLGRLLVMCIVIRAGGRYGRNVSVALVLL